MSKGRVAHDTIFRLLFGEKSNYERLASELLYNGSVPLDDCVTVLSLEHTVMHEVYNNIGLLVQDPSGGSKLVVLAEAHDVVPTNISIRMLMYATNTIARYLGRSRRDKVYGDRRVMLLPGVRFYVIYTGDEKTPGKYYLGDHFYDSDIISLDVEVISRYRRVPGEITDTYIKFCEIATEVHQKIGAGPDEIAIEISRRCKAEGVLFPFLKNYSEEEVLSVITQQERQLVLGETMK